MKSFTITSSILALVGAAAAQTIGFHAINLPGLNENVPACTTYTVVWTPAQGPEFAGNVIFQLIGGPTQNTQVEIGAPFGPVDGSVGTISWNVPCDEGNQNFYGLKVLLESNTDVFQFSTPFNIIPVAVTTTTADNTMTTDYATTGTMNTTMTTMTSAGTATTMSPNMTFTTPQPTPSTTVTSTSFIDPTTSETATTTSVPFPAGASRAMTGSFAVVAVAAAFFAL